MRPFRSFATEGQPGGSLVLDRLVGELDETFRGLERAVTNDKLARATFVAPGVDVTVTHALGAPPRTWEVVDLDAAAVVYRSPTVNAKPTTTIILRASAPCIAVLRFT